jgi:hypothetical protein
MVDRKGPFKKMPLNEQSLIDQISRNAKAFGQLRQRHYELLPQAIEEYRNATRAGWLSLEELAHAKQAAALPVEELHNHRQLARLALPEGNSYVVVATDGSIIPPDRHGGMAFCQVLNIGEVALGYGQRSLAHIEANTTLYLNGVAATSSSLTTASPATGTGPSDSSVDYLDPDHDDDQAGGANSSLTLETEMAVAELEVALRLTGDYWATVAMRDGPLTLWTSSILNNRESRALTARYVKLLARFGERGVPIVGYTSNTRSDVVMTALGVMARRSYAGLTDAQLFGAILAVGECSPAFRHIARHSKDSALTEEIRFMYLRTEDELVRLEFSQEFLGTPQLDTALAIIWHQLKVGQGYPVVLMEAHESAVLRQGDRELLRAVLESYGWVGQESQKGLSKRLRNL